MSPGFGFRLILLSLVCTMIALVFSHGRDWLQNISIGEISTLFGVVVLWSCVTLGILKLLEKILARLNLTSRILTIWVLMVLIAGIFYLTLFTPSDHLPESFNWPGRVYLTPSVGLSLLVMVFFLTPGLLWLEKILIHLGASNQLSQSNQFTDLGYRMRPHFLFNSLNSVAGLIRPYPDKAEAALYNLADVFRLVMADKRQLVPLRAELDLADKYLYLERIRLGDKIKVSFKIDPELFSLKLPIMLIQPLLENAVFHGIETRFQGGTITLNIQGSDNQMLMTITNPLPETSSDRAPGNKVAQQNLRERLEWAYGKDASFDAYESESRYTVVVRIPI